MKDLTIGKDGFKLPSSLITSTQAILDVFPNQIPLNIVRRMAAKTTLSETGCWEWTGYLKSGYGALSIHNHLEYIHRLSYLIFIGSIPDGMFTCHHCDNKPCWNPEHLFAGTSQDNHADMWAKGRGKTHPWRKGIDNCNATLTDDQILDIRASVGSQRKLAKIYGVSNSTIWRIRQMKSRAYLV